MRSSASWALFLTLVVACKGEARPPSTAETSGAPGSAAPAASDSAAPSSSAEPGSPVPSTAGATDGGAAQAALTFTDSGKHLNLGVGATFTVELRSNVGTGFAWAVNHADSTIVEPTGAPVRAPANPSHPGGPTAQKFTFTAKAPGSAHVEIALRRGFESKTAVKTFVVDVTVK